LGFDFLLYVYGCARIGPGDLLVFYSDGLIERRGESLDAGLERLALAVRSGPAEPQELCEHIVRSLLPDAAQLHDDVTVVVVGVV
jgi:serine phosphatase RsbU (regulator of sigma subunit)